MTQRIALCAVAAAVTGDGALAALSGPVLVDATASARHWETVFTNEVPLRWDWPADAESATLAVAGMNASFATNFAADVSCIVWSAFGSAAPSAEDVYDLTLTFFNSGGAPVETLTARLAVVAGAFGEAAVNAVAASPAWSKVKGNPVIPYDASWSPDGRHATGARTVIARRGGASQTNDFSRTAGYFGWKLRSGGWGYGVFDLTLTFAGVTNTWSAELTRLMDGTTIRVR